MKKIIYTLILPLVVVGGLVFANREIKNETPKKSIAKSPGGVPLSAAEMKAGRKQWEATLDGMMFNIWKASPAGKKALAGAAKISKSINDNTNMEAVVTSLSLPSGSKLGFGMMVSINGDDYILSFGMEIKNEFQQLHSLKVNDKIVLRSRGVSYAPKYSYPIVAGEYIERNNEIIYKRPPNKGGC